MTKNSLKENNKEKECRKSLWDQWKERKQIQTQNLASKWVKSKNNKEWFMRNKEKRESKNNKEWCMSNKEKRENNKEK